MTSNFLVRTGSWGEVTAMHAVDLTAYSHGQRVICKTERGLEIGQILSPADGDALGRLLRPMTHEDELVQKRLEKYKRRAVEQCRKQLATAGIETTLIDVEHLFDGKTLVFHFLGDTTPEINEITSSLADEYERNAKTDHFAKLLAEGCGPGCGTEDKGCGSGGGCAVCVVAGACSSKKVREPAEADAAG